jgi:hypothetical protein
MQRTKHFIVMLLCVLLSAPATLAQNPQRNGQTDNAVAQDVLIIIEQQQVRFTSRSAVEWMQLQVFNQSGEAVFDSSPIAAGELNWPFQNANGEAIKSGLYAYTLSLKEAGAETARVRRGHFIVDRAQDRDGADKLWVTSQNSSGVGTELTVARDETAAVAGTTTGGERTTGRRAESSDRSVEAEAQHQPQTAKATAAAVTAGTAGQIAKFTSGTDLGNSVMTEQNGNVGVGTANPVTKLDVRGSLTLEAGSSPGLFTAASGGEQNRYLALLNSPTYTSASGLKAGGILVSDSYAFANPGKNDLVVKGKVGIGTGSPESMLHLDGGGLTIDRHWPWFFLGEDYSFRVRNFMPIRSNTQVGTTVSTAFLIDSVGNVGIGTDSPQHRLSIVGSLAWTTNGWGGAVELENGAAIGWRANSAGQRFGMGHTNGGFYIFRTTSDPGTRSAPANYDFSISDTGVTSVRVLQITGGADFAENFDVSSTTPESETSPMKVEAGMVVSIDPATPGKLQLSTQAYDRRVAGIISGAGGVKPGMMMSQAGTLADGQHPVALSGRVYCWVDASQGAVEPGDLLTTSSTPGHAMKVGDPAQAQGAIIGKAMTSLAKGRGLVLVLVTLQ